MSIPKPRLHYDPEGDVLYISIGEPQPADDADVTDDDVVVRTRAGKIVGITILDARARIANRIVNEVPAVNRVVGACPERPPRAGSRRDITSKPPGTIEWGVSTMNRSRLGLPAALIFAVTAAACGGGDKNDGGRETTQATATNEATEEAVSFSEEEAKAAAQTAQLTIAEFPTGWVRRSAEPDESTFGPSLPAECQVFVEQEKFPGTVVELESDEFVSPDDETVSSSSTVYEDVEAGEAAFAAIRQFIDDCRQPLKDALTQLFRDTLKEQAEAENSTLQLELTEFNFDLMSFPEYGDESMAFRMGGKSKAPSYRLTSP